jgi:hypothetical protein
MHMLLLLPFAQVATKSTCHLAWSHYTGPSSQSTLDAQCKDPRGSCVAARHVWDQVPLNSAPRYDSSFVFPTPTALSLKMPEEGVR